jgi:hypothetical protein
MSLKLPNPMCVVVWLVFLLPGRLVGDRLDFALAVAIFAVACAVLWIKPSPWESRAPSREAALLFAGLQFLSGISYLYALAFKGAQSGLQNLLELPHWLLLGVFVVYLIRHYDASVRTATESAMTAALYGSMFLYETVGERTYVTALTLCYLLLFSRLRLRYLHAATAVVVLILSDARLSWVSSPDVLRLIGLSPLFGWGPARYEIVSTASNQYQLWFARGGALGACLIAVGLGLVTYRLLYSEDDLRRRAAVAVVLACSTLLLLSGPYLDGYRLFFATAFLIAAVHDQGRSLE